MTALDTGMLRRPRIRLIHQTEIAECGLACLAMISVYHGHRTDVRSLRQQFPPSLRGLTMKSLIEIGDQIGLRCRAVQVPLSQLGNLVLPAILHWNFNHFVVIESVRNGQALVHNPDGRSGWMDLELLSKRFTGVAVELQPADAFEPKTDYVSLRLNQLWHRIVGLKRSLLQIFALSLVLQLFVLLSPYYMQIAIDSVLPAQDFDLLVVLAIGFGLFALINGVATCLRGFVLLSAGNAVGFGLASNVARRLLRLPVEWFERRHLGDVLSRFQSVTPIQAILTEGAVAAVVDGLLALVTLAMMFFYSPPLALVALLAFAIYGAVRYFTFPAQRAAQEAAIVARGIEQTTLIESMRGIAALRLTNRETLRYAWWQAKMTDSANASIHVGRIAAWQLTANTVLFSLEIVISTFLAVRYVMVGGFSLGMLFAYMAYKTQFLDKGASLIDKGIDFRMLRLHLDRLADIALSKEDVSYEGSSVQNELEGRIELRNVSYRYSPADPWVLNDLSFIIEPGEHVAITGPSGGGKSTLVKILLGLIEPTSGELLVDGLPLARFGHKNYHNQLGAVLQEDSLFLGSLADNITLFDDRPDVELLERAARQAAIHDDILAMPMRYQTFVGNMGSTLSGGQKQRVLLARALYRAPKVLVVDEGTAHLDAAHERAVNEAMEKMGITRIVIAHRRETVSAADRVIYLHKGRIVEGAEPVFSE